MRTAVLLYMVAGWVDELGMSGECFFFNVLTHY